MDGDDYNDDTKHGIATTLQTAADLSHPHLILVLLPKIQFIWHAFAYKMEKLAGGCQPMDITRNGCLKQSNYSSTLICADLC